MKQLAALVFLAVASFGGCSQQEKPTLYAPTCPGLDNGTVS